MTRSFEEQIQATHAGSGAWYARAQQAVGGALGHDVRHALPFPTYIARAQGAYKWDVDGYRYIDYHVGNGALLLGHAHPAVVEAVVKAAPLGTRFGNETLNFEGIYFLNDYDNLVGTVTASTGGGGQIGDQYDGGEVVVQGFELSASTAWTELGNSSLSIPLSVNYTWTTEAEFHNAFESEFEPWGDVQVGDELPYLPEHQFRAMAGLESEVWSVNVAANYVGDMRATAGQGTIPDSAFFESLRG